MQIYAESKDKRRGLLIKATGDNIYADFMSIESLSNRCRRVRTCAQWELNPTDTGRGPITRLDLALMVHRITGDISNEATELILTHKLEQKGIEPSPKPSPSSFYEKIRKTFSSRRSST